MPHFYIVASNQFGFYMFSQDRQNQGTGGPMHSLHIMAVPKAKPSTPLSPNLPPELLLNQSCRSRRCPPPDFGRSEKPISTPQPGGVRLCPPKNYLSPRIFWFSASTCAKWHVDKTFLSILFILWIQILGRDLEMNHIFHITSYEKVRHFLTFLSRNKDSKWRLLLVSINVFIHNNFKNIHFF